MIKDKVAVLGPNDGDVKLFAPDGFTTQATIDEAGAASAGMFMSVAGVPIDAVHRRCAEFVQQLQEGPLSGKPIDPYAIYGAQAAQVMLDAIGDSDGSRADIIAKMFATDVQDGLLGTFTFSEDGDPSNASGADDGFTMYEATDKLETETTTSRRKQATGRRSSSADLESTDVPLTRAGGHCPPASFRFRVAHDGDRNGRTAARSGLEPDRRDRARSCSRSS